MSKKLTIKDQRQESRLFQRRAIAAAVGIGIFVLILVGRLAYLQIDKHQFYSVLSKHNTMNIVPVLPNRGLIYDRNGVLLAKNIPEFTLNIIPARVKSVPQTLKALSKILTITPGELQEFNHTRSQYRRYQPVPLLYKLTPTEIARFYVNAYRFPGVIVSTQMMRYYPLGKALSNVLGYVGRINKQELAKLGTSNYTASDFIGKVGIEKYYEPLLHGKMGAEEAEINAAGRIVRTLKTIPPVPGDNLYLTIDSKLQVYAEKILGKNSGAIVALQPNTGEVLALVTKPDYNPNLFVNGISDKQYENLMHSPKNPLFNRAIRGLYAPGSTIKPFYALGALSAGVITPQYTIYAPGWFRIPGTKHIFHDWDPYGHGFVNVTKAIIVSCDTFFYNLAVKMGITRMDSILHGFGFGQLTGIDMPEELPGLVPSPAWRLKTQGRPWYTGDTVITGIGQGSLLVTPIQLAAATSIIAERGMHFRPHLLLKIKMPNKNLIPQPPEALPRITLNSPKDWKVVIHAMEGVIRNPIGTALGFGRNPPFTVAGKTGTAQVFGTYRNEETVREYLPRHLRDNHLFISFAPVKNPKIVVVVVVEHNSYADNLSRKVIDFYFNELKHHNHPQSPSPKSTSA